MPQFKPPPPILKDSGTVQHGAKGAPSRPGPSEKDVVVDVSGAAHSALPSTSAAADDVPSQSRGLPAPQTDADAAVQTKELPAPRMDVDDEGAPDPAPKPDAPENEVHQPPQDYPPWPDQELQDDPRALDAGGDSSDHRS